MNYRALIPIAAKSTVVLLARRACRGHSAPVPTTLEFWPEYGDGPLWSPDGQAVDLVALSLSADLVDALRAWNATYDDSKLPFESNDEVWLHEGKRLLAHVRAALGNDYVVVVTEPWWGEVPDR